MRYKPHLKFFTLLLPVCSQIEEEGIFPSWETNGQSASFRNPAKRCSVGIEHDNFNYDQDSDDVELEQKHIASLLERLPSALEITSYFRIGYRRKYLTAVDIPFPELVSIMNLKFMSQHEGLTKILPGKVDDLLYRVNLAEDPYRFNLTVGPLRKNEVLRWMEVSRRNFPDENLDIVFRSVLEKYPNVAVFTDIDIYQHREGINTEEAALFVEYAREKTQKLAEELNAYLFATMEE